MTCQHLDSRAEHANSDTADCFQAQGQAALHPRSETNEIQKCSSHVRCCFLESNKHEQRCQPRSKYSRLFTTASMMLAKLRQCDSSSLLWTWRSDTSVRESDQAERRGRKKSRPSEFASCTCLRRRAGESCQADQFPTIHCTPAKLQPPAQRQHTFFKHALFERSA